MSRRSIHSDSRNTAGSSLSPLQLAIQPNFQLTTSHITRVNPGSQQTTDSSSMNLSSLDESHNPSSQNHQNDVPRAVIYKTTHTEHYNYRREIMYGGPGEEASNMEIRGRYDYGKQTEPKLDITGSMNIADSRRRLSAEERQRRVNAADSERSIAWRLMKHTLQYLYLFSTYILLLTSWLLRQFSNVRKWVNSRVSKFLWMALLGLIFVLFGYWILSHILSTMGSIIDFLFYPFTVLASVFNAQTNVSFEEKNDSTEKSETVPSVNEDMLEQISEKTNDHLRNYDISFLNQNLLQMIEKTEQMQQNHDDHLSNMSEVIATMKKDMEDLRRDYDNKLMNMENELKQMKALLLSSNNEIMMKVNDSLDEVASTIKIQMDVIRISKGNEFPSVGKGMTEGDVREIVKEALKVYDADKTGRVDYALESAGAQIISTRSTQEYTKDATAYSIFGFTLFYGSNNPRIVIQGKPAQPGACWAFQNFPGILLIKLRSEVVVTGFTLEHAPKSLLPHSQMKSAVRKFNVWGLKDPNDAEPVQFGDYEFIDSDESLQYFPVKNATITTPYQYVELRIQSNHGQLEYTCLYRFRVHGTPV